MKNNEFSKCGAVLAMSLVLAGSAAEAKNQRGTTVASGGVLIINTVKSKPVVLEETQPLDAAASKVKSRSITLGIPKLSTPSLSPDKSAADGMTFATRLQYVERLMSDAGFSSFKQVPDLSALTQRQGPVSDAQLTSVSNSYIGTQQYFGATPTLLTGVEANPTSATIDCTAFPYRPTGFMSSQNEYNRQVLFPHVRQAACDAGVPVGLFDALIVQESRYNAMARSHKDAFGLAQLMPATAKYLGVNRYTIYDNLRGGAKLLRQHLDEYGEVHLALAAYNAGPGNVAKYNGIPPFRETRNYVSTILDTWSQMSSY
jgi:Transglycosylase SLT domain